MTTIDADELSASTIDGEDVSEITHNGDVVWNAIPDSAVLHWPILDRSNSTIVEKLQNEDATANGTTNTANNWYGGFAEDGDGVDDHILTPPWTNWINVSNDFAVIFTFSTVDGDDSHFWGVNDGDSVIQSAIGHSVSSEGQLWLYLEDEDGTTSDIYTNATFDSGAKHRFVFNKISDSSANWEIWVDGVKESVTVNRDQAPTNFDISRDVAILARNVGGGTIEGHQDGLVDNTIICNDSLTSQEIEDDYNNQPWS